MEDKNIIKKAFTLIELLVVMAIIGVLASIAVGSFRTAQMRGRDAQRKADLKQVSNALELFYADYGRYPSSSSGNTISACPYPAETSCPWGSGTFTDSKTVYFKTLPVDPSSDRSYSYRIVPSSSNQKFQLFASLENSQDQDLLPAPGVSYSCGTGKTCNFAVTSANTNATEE